MHALNRIELKGFRSIKEMGLELRPLNVFIGANGSGKSNLISFFKLLNHMIRGDLQRFVASSGGANSLLHYGAKVTPQIEAHLFVKSVGSEFQYQVRLVHVAEDTLLISEEQVLFPIEGMPTPFGFYAIGQKESQLRVQVATDEAEEGAVPRIIDKNLEILCMLLDSCRVFQFHDTSSTAPIRQKGDIDQNRSLDSDGGNLAAMLYRIQRRQPECYQRIIGTIRQIAPFFEDFRLAPSELNPNMIQLRWKERDHDYDFGPHLLSDGTLRAMALVTLLLQPTADLPWVIIIDEPELGLHPYAIATLAGLLRSASVNAQILVATESATLLDQFEPEEVVVTERCMGGSAFKRLSAKELEEWRGEYCLSELWEKNVIGGRPAR